ncbi:PREDICTED: 5'-3' exoribonuclease 1 [Cyphomyrmex costatus]|uniref:5'-3' exoribonuclease 1 n=1 Tax=Cyphomyrmex costatus TaxID=456900 RepID=A0A151I7K8_9HYME|nr:PREDICTED: 5'-3' exoribonuclease 1 [Cyphomyrmex costatus]KYM94136.1 5'-3' exoribonuclease 1 [Cyphomyrmex costatus]
MGVPKFFRYISERYPCLSEVVKEHQIPEFDYLYLDMNGIIHTCSHPNDDVCFRITEEMIFKNIFHYIEVLFNMIRPQKLFFMAIDGVAPRAKINQQRGRRFRAAKDAEVQEAKAKAKGIPIPKEKRFDSNCITPGTLFMAKLGEQLKCFVEHKVSTDDTWKKCKILFSGSEVPGEGEHKIMDYIRYMKASKDYNSNSSHCLYGLDADLIMLGLCSHEPNFSLLREEVKFGKQQVKMTPEETKFCLLHLSLLREYIEHEFSPIKDKLSFSFDIEKIIDDWVLMGFLVGNDFIPHLPNLHIANGALPILYRAYMEVLPTLEGYINEAGTLKLDRFEKFMEKLSRLDVEQFNEQYADIKFFESKTGRRPNESERYIYKKTEDSENASPKKTQNKDFLDALIKNTKDMSLGNFDDDNDIFLEYRNMDLIVDDESDSEIYNMEFVQHKKDYYMNKLEYENVNEEVLRSQAEGYVRAIQWNLHYYYHGCCSWSWYYPHHYAPYISDVKDFKDLKLEFDLGEPFLPFQQLLAVLPAFSKDLLPEAFQSLLTEESSPIINYYPHNFKTDLNGKRQEWEAVVLIPFIDEKLLLAAMQPHLSRLTLEEQARNKYGPMCLYSYTDEIQSVQKTTLYFPEFTNHAQVKLMNREDIFVPREQLIRGLSPSFDLNIYYPGFPILRHLDHTPHLEKARVKVFQQHSVLDSMILTIISKPTPDLTTLASNVLGKSVYVEWPHLKEVLVVGVADCNVKLSLINQLGSYSDNNLKKEDVKGALAAEWNIVCKQVKELHMSRLGIDIGDTKVLLYARSFLGNKHVFGVYGKVTVEKQWNDYVAAHAYQTVVKDISVYSKTLPVYETMHDIFIPGTFCFMLGHPYYGAMGEVVQNKEDCKSRRIKISIKAIKEPTFDTIRQAYGQQKARYMLGGVAAQRLGISSHLLSRITGTIYVIESSTIDVTKHNLGLNLKFSKRNEEVPGYTKKENNQWLYSSKAIDLIRNYMTKCPYLFERLAQNVANDIFQEEELFTKGSDELKDTIAWLKMELNGLESRTCGMDVIEPYLIKQIEEEVEKYLETEETMAKTVFMQVKPQLLYKPDLHLRNVSPDPNSQNRLFDRIRCVRNGFSVPLGAKGTITGVRNGSNSNDTMYDVLFDKPFIGGFTLNGCSQFRGYRLSTMDFVNISFGERMEQGNVANELPESWRQTSSASPSKKNDQSMLNAYPQMQLAKKGLEKLNRDICLRMAQHGIELNSKTIPCKTLPQTSQHTPPPPNRTSEFQALWNELHKMQKPNGPPEKVAASSSTSRAKSFSNDHSVQSSQDPSAFLKAVLKIPDVNLQTNKQESTPQQSMVQQSIPQQSVPQSAAMLQKATVPQKDQNPPPLVQQLFDRARQTEQKKEKANAVWYSTQLLKHFSYNGSGIPKYNYVVDEKTGLISANVMLMDNRIFQGDPCTTHEQATESAAKKAYKALNLNKTSMHDTKVKPMIPHWFNTQNNWIQNIRPPIMPPMGSVKIPPLPLNMPMQPNIFYPKWNPKLPPTPAFMQLASYSQSRQLQMKHQIPQKGPQNGSKMEIKNSTAFVPLQAQKKSRNASVQQASKETHAKKSSPSKTQQQPQKQQKQEETLPKKQKPEVVNKAREKIASNEPQQQPKQQPQQQSQQQSQQNAGKSSRPRKSRVAAKFGKQPLLNGGEPPQ